MQILYLKVNYTKTSATCLSAAMVTCSSSVLCFYHTGMIYRYYSKPWNVMHVYETWVQSYFVEQVWTIIFSLHSFLKRNRVAL